MRNLDLSTLNATGNFLWQLGTAIACKAYKKLAEIALEGLFKNT